MPFPKPFTATALDEDLAQHCEAVRAPRVLRSGGSLPRGAPISGLGITRLAKNILGEVVGRYLDRNRQTVATLRRSPHPALTSDPDLRLSPTAG